ncbi:MAG: response regulator transcription factor [Betaproteobacteria bacterium]|nr:response regulator transcription factor [Betaproteobacteria bacterium]MDE2124806.1 response regulator transcription factor [Betaproteobacteria bacterium]MDE2187305.1 response regulator transcription factor [Betaproteobacteria bacterium]MDE2323461.1 response regulator transcription factor [Betaproteobacteria bacterium]
MNLRLLLVEDDARLGQMVDDYLTTAGWQVTRAMNLAQSHAALGLDEAVGRGPGFDAMVLDLMLPDGDGLDLCRRLRSTGSDLPVLMLTARGDPLDRVIGLELGADDYLPKPFEPRELLARLRAIVRRRQGVSEPTQVLRFGRLEVDPAARQVRVDGEARQLTGYQFDLLLALARHPGRVLSRDFLLDAVNNTDAPEVYDRSIDVHISRIRAVLEDDPRHPRRILTLRGAGYVFARTQDAA